MRPPDPADILALALAFYRTPIQYQELLRTQAELPGDMAELLRIANQEGPAIEAGCRATGAQAAELCEAALFFIEQVCLVRGASHYQVLGLNPQASAEQIKDHHRLLMRLFHPDQLDTRERWIDVYARRVNQAYNILRNPASRQAYDVSLKASQQRPLLSKDDLFKSPPSVTWPGFGLYLPPLLWRYLPQLILGGIGVIALLLVTRTYLSNQQVWPRAVNTSAGQVSPSLPPPAEKASPQAVTADRKGETVSTGLSKPPSSQPLTRAVSEPSRDKATQNHQEGPAKAISTKDYPPLPQGGEGICEYLHCWKSPKMTFQLEPAPTKPPRLAAAPAEQAPPGRPSPPPTPVKVEKRPVVDKVVPKREQPVVAEVVSRDRSTPPPSVIPAKKDPTSISEWELNMLIGKFISAYKRGDLKEFIALFDDHARTNESNNKAGIRKDYKRLFDTTQTRRMALENLRWREAGASSQGDGRFQVQVWKRSGLPPEKFTGTIHLLVEKRDGKVLIKNFYYVLDKAS